MSQTARLPKKPRVANNSIPSIALIPALRPSAESAESERLEYPLLKPTVDKHWPFREARERRVATVAPGSIELEQAKIELKKQELLDYAWALQEFSEPLAQRQWSDRFTKASVALYGTPDHDTAWGLVNNDLKSLSQLVGRPEVDQGRLQQVLLFYKEHFDDSTPSHKPTMHSDAALHDIARAVKHYFKRRFGRALDALVDGGKLDLVLEPKEIANRFEAALGVLQSEDPMWLGWEVVMQDSGSLSVKCGQHRILVGEQRVPLELAALPGGFAHEVLVHVLRQLHATRLGDQKLYKGLAGYTDSEEGLASFVEYSINGIPPRRAVDRYIDIAFAMGLFGREPVTRREMFELTLDRKVVLDQAAGKQPKEADVIDGVWTHVNRIYRGTRGQDVVGVFTKDVVYYHGFQEIATYLLSETKDQSIDRVLDYLLCCKFNPFDKTQADYVKQAVSKRLHAA